jgi:VIT1/CCC1 family predicted Fe2+/Mn2+ transporter
MHPHHHEDHAFERTGWLRAAVLGANDGIVSTAALIVGVAASAATREAVLTAGIAALVAGAMSMAAGEYVSVSSQADSEAADIARERRELEDNPEFEHEELAAIYRARGLPAALADQVAAALSAHDALGAHLRDELGMMHVTRARPVQAALASAVTFAVGAALPLLVALLLPLDRIVAGVAVAALVLLVVLGALGARVGNAPVGRAMLRVGFWGAAALAATWAIGRLFGAAVS